MIVPDVSRASRVKRLREEADEALVIQNENHIEQLNDRTIDVDHRERRKSRAFGRGTVFPKITAGSGRTVPYRRNSGAGMFGRQECPHGRAYYSCANGFKGCCSSDPCGPIGGCPDNPTTTIRTSIAPSGNHRTYTQPSTQLISIASTLTRAITATTIPQGFSTTKSEESHTSPPSDLTTSSFSSSSSSSGTISTTSPSPPATTLLPSCPKGNGTLYSDKSSIEYLIRCGEDNTFPVSSITQVRSGGYSTCFTPCSESPSCAGFTFIGGDSGKCYFKSSLPLNEFEPSPNSKYITCAKTNSSASVANPSLLSGASSKGKTGSIGAAIGGVVGGVALVGLVFLVIAILARRNRRKVEEMHTHSVLYADAVHGIPPAHTTLYHHRRGGSTGHDMSGGQFGGAYDPPSPVRSHARQRSIYREDQTWI